MTQMDDAKKGIITEEMKAVAKAENVTEEFIRKSVAQGTIAIPSNIGVRDRHRLQIRQGTGTFGFSGRRVGETPSSGIAGWEVMAGFHGALGPPQSARRVNEPTPSHRRP